MNIVKYVFSEINDTSHTVYVFVKACFSSMYSIGIQIQVWWNPQKPMKSASYSFNNHWHQIWTVMTFETVEMPPISLFNFSWGIIFHMKRRQFQPSFFIFLERAWYLKNLLTTFFGILRNVQRLLYHSCIPTNLCMFLSTQVFFLHIFATYNYICP